VHPRHLFCREDIPEIVRTHEAELRVLRRNIEQAYKDGIPEMPMYHRDPDALPYREFFGRYRDFVDRNLVALSLGWALLGDEKAGAFAKEILLTICEEKGLLGSLHFDYSDIKSEIAYALDSPGHIGRIILAAPHSAKLQVEVFGKAAHAGTEPEKGKSATVGAAKILATIREGRLDHESTANFPIFQAGHGATNAVCDYAIIKGESRSLDKQKLMDYIAYFEKHCQETAEAFGVTAKTEWTMGSPGFKVEKESASVRLVSEVFAQMGVTPLPEAGGGGMDANRYNYNGMQAVGLATGYFDNHTINEHVFLDSFLRTGEMVMRIVLEYGEHKDKYSV
jgi:tripeptide aminopeptidase